MDSEMRTRAKDAIRRIFSYAAYEVDDLESPLDLSAMKGEDCVVIMVSDEPREAGEFNARNFKLRIGERDITCKKLLFTMNESLKLHTCTRWGPADLAARAGEAVLAEVLNRPLHITLEVEHLVPGESNQELVGPEILHLPLKIDAKRAVQIAGIEGSPHCRYIPYWQYHSVCKGERTYKGQRVMFSGEKEGVLNAINGQYGEMPEGTFEKSGILADGERVSPKISKDEASQRIMNVLVEEQVKKVRIRQEKGDAIFYEEKLFKPEGDEVRVDLSLVYIPVWEVKGKKIVEVNAFSGEVLTEPMDEGCEIL